MTLLFCDGFGHIEDGYETAKWDAADVYGNVYYASTVGRDGGSGVYFHGNLGNLTKSLGGNYQTLIVGFAIKFSALSSNGYICSFIDTSSTQLVVDFLEDGTIFIDRYSGNRLATSDPGVLIANTWQYLEIKITIHNSTGSVALRINGVEVASASGIDTQYTGNAYVNIFRLSGSGSTYDTYIDDLYICDDSGSKNNDFLGDINITTLYPNADGTYSQFTPSSGSDHYALVDEAQLTNDDADYTESSTAGNKETFTFETYSGTTTILAVQSCMAVKNTDAGTLNVQPVLISGTSPTETDGSNYLLPSTTKCMMSIYEKEPIDDVDWTASKVNSSEFGLRIEP